MTQKNKHNSIQLIIAYYPVSRPIASLFHDNTSRSFHEQNRSEQNRLKQNAQRTTYPMEYRRLPLPR